jgi:hypothetical protein
LYFIANHSLKARKIGITNSDGKRSRLAHFGSEWTVIKTVTHKDGLLIKDIETLVLTWLRKDLGMPVFLGRAEMGWARGQTETFSMEGPTDLEVIEKIEEFISFAERDTKSKD